jgi:hypothetical protein
VHDFRERRGINDPIRPIDWAGVYWRRSGDCNDQPQCLQNGANSA